MATLDDALAVASQLEHELAEAIKAPEMAEEVRASVDMAINCNRSTKRMIEYAIAKDDQLHSEEF